MDRAPKGKVETDREVELRYIKGWCEMMVEIWHDRLMQLRIKDTGALYNSLQGQFEDGAIRTITHKFLEYGIYVAAGVGKGYTHGNSGGDDVNGLQFLRGHKEYWYGHHRQRRDWFATKYIASMHKLLEKEVEFNGLEYNGIMSTMLDEYFDKHSNLRSL